MLLTGRCSLCNLSRINFTVTERTIDSFNIFLTTAGYLLTLLNSNVHHHLYRRNIAAIISYMYKLILKCDRCEKTKLDC